MTIFSSDLKQRITCQLKNRLQEFQVFYSAFFAKSLHNSDSRLTFSLFRSLFWDIRVYFRSCTLNANSGIAFCLHLIILLHFKRKYIEIFLFHLCISLISMKIHKLSYLTKILKLTTNANLLYIFTSPTCKDKYFSLNFKDILDYVIVRAGNKNRIKWRMKRGKNKTSRRLHINPRLEQREPCISIEKFQLSFPEIDGVWLTRMKNWGVWLITHHMLTEKLYVYQSQVQWVKDAALVLRWWEKVQSF